jgi:hypothetical protein
MNYPESNDEAVQALNTPARSEIVGEETSYDSNGNPICDLGAAPRKNTTIKEFREALNTPANNYMKLYEGNTMTSLKKYLCKLFGHYSALDRLPCFINTGEVTTNCNRCHTKIIKHENGKWEEAI